MVPRAATDQVSFSLPYHVLSSRPERFPGRFPSSLASAFPETSFAVNGRPWNSNNLIRLSSWVFETGAINVSFFPLCFVRWPRAHTQSSDWNENVVPRLLPIFRSVQQQVEGKARRGVVETRKQESAERSAQLIEPLPDNTVPRRALEDNDQTPTAPETLSSVRDELAILVDRELAPNHSTMANSFRSVHQGILSPDMSAVSDREFLEKVVTMFACKSCKAVYDYKAHANHGTECVKAIRARSLGSKSSGPVGRHAVLLALHLLQLFGLPEDSTRALVEEMFCETKFVCLCGNPKFRKQVGFFELVRLFPTLAQAGLFNQSFAT